MREKRTLLTGIMTLVVLLLCLLPSMKVRAENWVIMYPYDETEEPDCLVEYDLDTNLIRATITTNDGLKKWDGSSGSQSVASMFTGMQYESINIGKDVTHIDNRAFAPLGGNVGQINIDENNTKFKLQDGMIVNMSGDTVYVVLKSYTDEHPDEITLPDTITTIGSHAFDGNKNIKIVNAPKVTGIDGWAFSGSSVTKFTCENPDYIGENVFQNCEALEEVVIDTDDGVTLQDASFTGCKKLKAFPYKTTNVPMNVFAHCEALEAFTIGNDISEIGSYAFAHCAALAEMTVPATVTSVSYSAFDSCANLKTVTFESAVPPTFGEHVFTSCPSDFKIVVPAGAEEAYIEALGLDYYDNIYETGVEKYGVFINGVQFTNKKTTVPCGNGNAVYDPGTKTLTLNNVTVNESTIVKTYGSWIHGGSIYSKADTLTIIVNGTNNISADADGISTSSGSNVTIKGTGKLVLDTLADSDPQMASMYVGLGDDPTGVDGGDLIIDGPEVEASREIQANRNLIIKGGSKVVTKGRLRSNNNGDIKILEEADVTAAWIDLSLPSEFSPQEVYQRDMHVVLDGGKLTLQGKERSFGNVNGILFCPNAGEERDPRGHVELKEGTLIVEKAVDDGKLFTDCPDENIVIDSNFKDLKDGSALTVEKLQKGGFSASTREESKKSVTEIFDDVKAGQWYVKAIQYVYDNNIMGGKGSSFQPNNPLTREEFVRVLYNHAGTPGATIENPYADVKAGAWYEKSVLWAKENNIANGKVKDGKAVFGVGDRIKREELALMIYKYAKLRGYDLTKNDTAINGFSDANKVSTWAKDAMNWAVTQGVMGGKGGKLDPQGQATRAECASMIKNMIEKTAPAK